MNHCSQKTCTRHYGYLLDFCRRTGRLVHDAAPAAQVVPETMDAFLAELQTRVGSVTRHAYVSRIRRVAEILDPARDFRWLRLIERELKDQARPRSRAHRVVDSRRLWRLGLDLMERAEKAVGMTTLRRARLYRDGLMVALLSVCTVRLGNYAFLEVDRHLRKINGEWWMLFSAEETKSRRPDERPVPAALTAAIDRWLSHWRGFFKNPGSAFWVSTKGGNLAYTYVGTIITEVTRRELGVAVSPHLFRHSAVHTVAILKGDQMGIASGVLQHTDPRTTGIYDIKGRSVMAGRALQSIVKELERSR